MKFILTLPLTEVQTSYQAVLKQSAEKMTIKGFRPGKAPLSVVEENLDQAKIYQTVLSRLLQPAYAAYIKDHNLHPIANPRVNLKQADLDKDWVLEVEIAEKPVVKLGQYKDAIKASSIKSKIWTPGQAKDAKKPDSKTAETDRLNHLIDILLKTCEVNVPDLLIDEETDHRLSSLIYQIDKLGLTLDTYTASINKTPDTLKTDYRQAAEAALKLEFIYDAIATAEKLQADDQAVDAFIAKIDDPNIAQKIKADTSERASLATSITKHQVTDYLLAL
jgi:FKBP-type peptidyl-prolyl cis-trans isomerase (trigger factor)